VKAHWRVNGLDAREAPQLIARLREAELDDTLTAPQSSQ
jgi:hypothetical protein